MVVSVVVAVLAAVFAAPALAKVVTGTNKDNYLRGTAHKDQMNGLKGDDNIWGKSQSDELFGGPGEDSLSGAMGADHITGGRQFDKLHGGPGRDVLYAHDGYRDKLDCGSGVDRVYIDATYTPTSFTPKDIVLTNCEFLNGEDFRP
jgi:Ca2+-binding RTX toxin-like protein